MFLLAVLGLALYLIPAAFAPVVRSGDSETDLRWAREGIGLWKPLTAEESRRISVHSLKPGYLLFLRIASRLHPGLPERSIVLVQSLLLWCGIAASCLWVRREVGPGAGAAAYCLLLLFVPLRQSASSIGPEAICSALALALFGFVLGPPQRAREVVLAACGLLALFWIRPNVGAVMFLMAILGGALHGGYRRVAEMGGIFLAGVLAIWAVTAPFAGTDSKRALPDAILVGSAEYNWTPSLEPWPASRGTFLQDPRMRQAVANWKRALTAAPADRIRDVAWRAFHGFFGLDYFDSRWSVLYRYLDHGYRIVHPLAILALVAISLAAASSASLRPAGICAWALFVALIAHNMLFSSSPRLLLPYLSFFVLFAARTVWIGGRDVLALACAIFSAGLLMLACDPQVSSWDWGVVESAAVEIQQTIPRRSLPRSAPAMLHLRVMAQAAPAEFAIYLDGQLLYRASSMGVRKREIVSIPLSPALLEENLRGPIQLRLISQGQYGPYSFLLFPVVPRPWREPGRRRGSSMLSPASDLESGSLEWWAHPGVD